MKTNVCKKLLVFSLAAVTAAPLCAMETPPKKRVRGSAVDTPAAEASLRNAAENGFLEKVKKLLADDVNSDAQDEKGRTALHYAVKNGRAAVVSELLRGGAKANIQDNAGKTPLHYVIECCSKDMIPHLHLLITKESVNLADIAGRSPLFYAVQKGNVDYVQLLLKSGATIHAPDAMGITPLQVAEEHRWDAIVTLLRQYAGQGLAGAGAGGAGGAV